MDSQMIPGRVAPGWESVVAPFLEVFQKYKDFGASCSCYVAGKEVFSLAGGFIDKAKKIPFTAETLVPVYSVSKFVTNITIGHLVSKGLIDLSSPVSKYWPKFAQNGKENITVSQLMGHQAGLTDFDGPIPLEVVPKANEQDKSKCEQFGEFLAKQTPKWPFDETKCGYHAFSLGWYLSELVRHVDPKHRQLSVYFREEIALPNAIDFHFGLTDSSDESRMTRLHQNTDGGFNPRRKDFSKALGDPTSRTNRSYNVLVESRPWHTRAHEIPSAVGYSNADALAKLMGMIALSPSPLVSPSTVHQLLTPTKEKFDVVQLEPCYLTYGGLFYQPLLPISKNNLIGHHYGYGGSMAYIDLNLQLSFSFATNTQRFDSPSPRELNILQAVYECLEGKAKL